MSSIPNSAMKHAQAGDIQMEQDDSGSTGRRWSMAQMSQQMSDGASRVAEKARENPGAALAVGATVIGAVAAAAVPLFRWGRDTSSTSASRKATAGKSGGASRAKSGSASKSGRAKKKNN